jgi:hypothetical protein
MGTNMLGDAEHSLRQLGKLAWQVKQQQQQLASTDVSLSQLGKLALSSSS